MSTRRLSEAKAGTRVTSSAKRRERWFFGQPSSCFAYPPTSSAFQRPTFGTIKRALSRTHNDRPLDVDSRRSIAWDECCAPGRSDAFAACFRNGRSWRTSPVEPMTASVRIPSVPGPSPAPVATAADFSRGPARVRPVRGWALWNPKRPKSSCRLPFPVSRGDHDSGCEVRNKSASRSITSAISHPPQKRSFLRDA